MNLCLKIALMVSDPIKDVTLRYNKLVENFNQLNE
jgi:hypothetical protein